MPKAPPALTATLLVLFLHFPFSWSEVQLQVNTADIPVSVRRKLCHLMPARLSLSTALTSFSVPHEVEVILQEIEGLSSNTSISNLLSDGVVDRLEEAELSYAQTTNVLERILIVVARIEGSNNSSTGEYIMNVALPASLLIGLPSSEIVGAIARTEDRKMFMPKIALLRPSQRLAFFLNFVKGPEAELHINDQNLKALFALMKEEPAAVASLTQYLTPNMFHPEDNHDGFEKDFNKLNSEEKEKVAAAMPLSLVRESTPL